MIQINSAEPTIWGNKVYNENISRYVTVSSWLRWDLPSPHSPMLTLKPQERCHQEQEGLAVEACGLSHTQGVPEGPTAPGCALASGASPLSPPMA